MCVEPETIAYIHRHFEPEVGLIIVIRNHKLAAWIQGLSGCTICMYEHVHMYVYMHCVGEEERVVSSEVWKTLPPH